MRGGLRRRGGARRARVFDQPVPQPLFNRRDDEYGGAVEGRARLAVEVVRSVCASVPRDFPVLVKMNSERWRRGRHDRGGGSARCVHTRRGRASAIDVSGAWRLARVAGFEGGAAFAEFARRLVDRVDIPVLLTGDAGLWPARAPCRRASRASACAARSSASPIFPRSGLSSGKPGGSVRRAACPCDRCSIAPDHTCALS